MIGITLYIVLFSVLLVIFVQDIKYRAVSVIAFPILLIAVIGFGFWYNSSPLEVWNNLSFNVLFLLVQYGILTLYFSLKHRQLINITKTYLGLGDVLFLLCCTGAFSPMNFIIFYLLSTVIVIFIHAITKIFAKVNPKIPLAGLQALMLILVLVSVQLVFKGSVYDDSWLLTYYL